MAYPGQGLGFGGMGMGTSQATSPYASIANYGMGSPLGASPSMGMSMPYSPPSYYGFPNMQPAASSLYSAYSGMALEAVTERHHLIPDLVMESEDMEVECIQD